MIVCEYLLDDYFLILHVDGACEDVMDNHFIDQHNELCLFPKALNPCFVLFKFLCFCYREGENLYITALELMSCNHRH